MILYCNAAVHKHNTRSSGNHCHNPGMYTCFACAQQRCSTHMKQRCSQGAQGRFGTLQHVTKQQNNEIYQAKGLSITDVQIVTTTNDQNRKQEQIAIVFNYMTQDKRPRIILTYPGGINHTGQGQSRQPDDELKAWLSRNNMNQNPVWTSRQRCIAAFTAALKPAWARTHSS